MFGKKKSKLVSDLPKHHRIPSINVFLGAGLLILFSGVFIMFFLVTETPVRIIAVRPFLLLAAGGFILYRTITGKRTRLFVFCSMLFISWGALFLLIDTHILPYTIAQIWPAMVILGGFALMPAGFSRKKRIQPVFAVPSLMLVFLGIIFLFFSLDIIKQSFISFASKWWPLVLVLSGLILVIIYIYRRNTTPSGDAGE